MRGKHLQVLLVEDNPADARLLSEALREVSGEKLDLHHVERLKQAFSRIDSQPPDVLLLDLSLPDSQGLETVAKAQAKAPYLAIVVLTGNDDEETALEAVRLGAQDYLFKGETNGQLLLRAMYYALERKTAQEEQARLIKELQEALSQVKQLSGLLPICASCKSIRDDQGYWQQLEQYMDHHSEVKFTHSVCPTCARKLYPELYENGGLPGKRQKKKKDEK